MVTLRLNIIFPVLKNQIIHPAQEFIIGSQPLFFLLILLFNAGAELACPFFIQRIIKQSENDGCFEENAGMRVERKEVVVIGIKNYSIFSKFPLRFSQKLNPAWEILVLPMPKY